MEDKQLVKVWIFGQEYALRASSNEDWRNEKGCW